MPVYRWIEVLLVVVKFSLRNYNFNNRFVILHCMKSVQIRSFFWSVFSCIWTEYEDFRSKSPYSVRRRENTDQKKVRIWTLFSQCLLNGLFIILSCVSVWASLFALRYCSIYTCTLIYKIWSKDKFNFVFLEKGLGIVFPPHFV